MILERMKALWPIAKILHEARRDIAWGPQLGPQREPWPEFSPTYTHAPVAYVDLALRQAEGLSDAYNMILTPRRAPC